MLMVLLQLCYLVKRAVLANRHLSKEIIMSKHDSSKDHKKNKEALGLVKRGKLYEAALILSTTSNANQTSIKNRIGKAKDARKTQSR